MEVKPGYKQTEVGVIPDDWHADYIEKFAVITTGSKNTQDRVQDGLYPFFVRSQTVERINSYSFDGEAVLTAGDGVGTGKVFHYINGRFDVHQRVYRISNFTDRVNGYFFYLCFSTHFYNRIMRMTAKSSVDSVRRDMISRMQVALPPTEPEQRAIATALIDVDGLLGGLDRLIAKKRDLKQATMQQLLTGQTRLPGYSGEWEVKRLGNVAEIVMGQSPSSSNYNTTGVGLPLIQGNADIDNRKTIKRIFTTQITKGGKSGDILMSVRAPVGEVSRAVFDVCLGRGVCAIRYDNDFMFHCLIYLEPTWARHSKGSTFDSVNSADVKALEVQLPPTLTEQTAIAEVLTEMDAELAVLEQRQEKTRALKQAMMQELLTGKIRLVPPLQGETEKSNHNWQINEAVIIGALALQFGTEAWPLPRKRRVKLTYLLHRHTEGKAEGYLKKAAGPYNPKTKYQGPEGIALKNGYVREHNNGRYGGLIGAGKIAQAEQYFADWYPGGKEWVEQFRFSKTDDLEVLATVDMAMEDLKSSNRAVSLEGVKEVIRAHPEWEAKLSRSAFSDANIAEAMSKCNELFMSSTPDV
jgi:type I restriction enzyme S subunit